MSNDQLSWENLLTNQTEAKAKEKAGEWADERAHEKAPAKANSKGDTKTEVTVAPVVAKSDASKSDGKREPLMSQLDWAPLNGASVSSRTRVDVKSEANSDANITANVKALDTSARTKASSRTSTPTPASAATARVKVSPTTLTPTPTGTGSTNSLSTLPPVSPLESRTMGARSVAETLGLQATNGAAAPAARDVSASMSSDEDSAGEVAKPTDEPAVMSVYELNRSIRSILEGKFPTVWVKAEISNFKAHTSGHWYFSLKDAKAQISGVMFRGFNQQIKFRPDDGMEVIVRGRITVYEPRGNYQIFCEMMEPVGAGALQRAFEQLKAKLQAEGLFDQARKRPLPSLPKHIAIVTSPTGAAIRDMLNVLGRRFKGARITLIPTKVQGEQAAPEICAALALANRLKDVDVMIVGRGGGSIEDMWCFNDERVARAIAAVSVPVISAVGHEIDFTIADFVADLRAPTPSAAAELVVKNAADLKARIETLQRAARLSQLRRLQSAKQEASSLAKRLVVVDPQRRIQDCMQRNDELVQRLEAAALRRIVETRMNLALLREKLGHPEQRIGVERQKLRNFGQRLVTGWKTLHGRKRIEIEKHMALLDSLSPLRVVERGYSLVTLDGQVVNTVSQVREGDVVRIQFAEGQVSATVTRIENRNGVRELTE